MFIKGYMCIKQNGQFEYLQIRPDIQVKNMEEASQFLKQLKDSCSNNKDEYITGYLFTVIK